MSFEVKILICKECSEEFAFSAGEQEFFSQKGFHAPTRCKKCRQIKRNNQGNSDKNAHQQMYKITCARCKREAQIPFKPIKGRLLFCRMCYQRGGAPRIMA